MPERVIPLAAISPVRDEAKYLHFMLDSIVTQTYRPAEWLFVDDGSKDNSVEIIKTYAAKYPFIRLISRVDRGFRQLGSGVVEAFNFGLRNLKIRDYQYIAKVDGDMSFPSKYLEVMISHLEANPKLAAVSGKVYRLDDRKYVHEYMTDEMVAGQFKLYKRVAFEDIGGFNQSILWDGIDIHRCRMKGYSTRSFFHPEARLVHHRQMGSSDRSILVGRARLGRGIWYMGYHPLYACASAIFRIFEKPYLIGGAIIISNYISAALNREPRIDDQDFIKSLQSWQLRKLIKTILLR